ncbi:MAG TPA: hypothetical protein VIQ53_02185 [Inquilinus sp.]
MLPLKAGIRLYAFSTATGSRAAGDLCARGKADRKAHRARQHNHVTAEDHSTDMHERIDTLYEEIS